MLENITEWKGDEIIFSCPIQNIKWFIPSCTLEDFGCCCETDIGLAALGTTC